MKMRQIIVVLASAVAAAGCSSGSGRNLDLGPTYQPHPGDYNRPTEDNQDPSPAAGGGSSTPSTGEQSSNNPGSSGSSGQGSSGSSGNTPPAAGGCPPCDSIIRCDITVTGSSTTKTTASVKTTDGVCALEGGGSNLVLACGGQLLQNGQPVGTWANCAKTTTTTPVDAGGPPQEG